MKEKQPASTLSKDRLIAFRFLPCNISESIVAEWVLDGASPLLPKTPFAVWSRASLAFLVPPPPPLPLPTFSPPPRHKPYGLP